MTRRWPATRWRFSAATCSSTPLTRRVTSWPPRNGCDDQIIARGITTDITVFEPAAGRGLVVARIPGSEPLKPLVINHHIDVVAADPAVWTQPPFSGALADGYVWGRGTLDTKNLGIISR